MTTQSAYVRDAWRFGDRATLNLGLRYERYHVFLPAQSKEAGRFYPGGRLPVEGRPDLAELGAPRRAVAARSTRTTGPW